MLRPVYSDKKHWISTTFLPWIFWWFVKFTEMSAKCSWIPIKVCPVPGLAYYSVKFYLISFAGTVFTTRPVVDTPDLGRLRTRSRLPSSREETAQPSFLGHEIKRI